MASFKKWVLWASLALLICVIGGITVLKHDKAAPDNQIPGMDSKNISKPKEHLSESFLAGLSIGYTSDRMEQYMDKFSIKLVREPRGWSKKKLTAYFKKVTLSTSYQECSNEMEDLFRWVTNEYHKDYSPQILLFLARFCIEVGAHEKAIKFLEVVVQKNEFTWSSMGLCVQGVIYEEYLDQPERARQVYSQVLAHYPDSLEVTYANKALKRI